MVETETSQSELSRVSGVRQPSISQMLSGKLEVSDAQLSRLLACMGYRLEVVRRPVAAELTRSERRSWDLHRRLAAHVTPAAFEEWRPAIERNIERLRASVRGEPHLRHLQRWDECVESGDLRTLRRVLTGLDRESIEMREVSPMGGLLPEAERRSVIAGRR